MAQPIYAVGDIHGQIEELERILALIEADGGPEASVIFLGDYVDRGPNSKAVVARLMDGVANGRNWTCLKGNHDRYLVRFYNDMTVYDARTRTGLVWLNPRLGGDKTLLSYDVVGDEGMPLEPILAAARANVPEEHIAFLDTCPLYHETDDLLFVHAGIKPEIPVAEQDEDDLIWIRDGFLDFTGSFGKLVVHGHTALDQPEHAGNRVNLDGGAGYFRPLNAAVFEGSDCWLLTDAGRVALRP
ncbi:MAG: metallophosphoesterase family protein [Roseobacter sp.]|jgi:serine/threonine protein phosphatase 1|nr:metallophosphoesterase family protein [Roseobacter sp.]